MIVVLTAGLLQRSFKSSVLQRPGPLQRWQPKSLKCVLGSHSLSIRLRISKVDTLSYFGATAISELRVVECLLETVVELVFL